MTGGCQCGRIRYAVRPDNNDACLCHCRMCRKAAGGGAAAFVQVAHAGAESLHEAWLDTRALPRHRSDQTPSVADRWKAAGLEVPE